MGPAIPVAVDQFLASTQQALNISRLLVPSVCLTITSCDVEAWRLRIVMVLTLRCVLPAGQATIVVVVAELIDAVLVRPGVIEPERLSSHDACTSVVAAEDVTTEMASDVDVSRIMPGYFPERPLVPTADAELPMFPATITMKDIDIRRSLFSPRSPRFDLMVLRMAAARREACWLCSSASKYLRRDQPFNFATGYRLQASTCVAGRGCSFMSSTKC